MITEDVIYVIEDYLEQMDIIACEEGWTSQEKLCGEFAAEIIISILNKNSNVPPLIMLEGLRNNPWTATGEMCGRFLLWNMIERVSDDIIQFLVS